MTNLARHLKLTVDDYLSAEDGADSRHEYIDGELYAMTGASDRHGLITLNIASDFWFPRSSVGASRDAPASRHRSAPLERCDGIPTRERGNEQRARM